MLDMPHYTVLDPQRKYRQHCTPKCFYSMKGLVLPSPVCGRVLSQQRVVLTLSEILKSLLFLLSEQLVKCMNVSCMFLLLGCSYGSVENLASPSLQMQNSSGSKHFRTTYTLRSNLYLSEKKIYSLFRQSSLCAINTIRIDLSQMMNFQEGKIENCLRKIWHKIKLISLNIFKMLL